MKFLFTFLRRFSFFRRFPFFRRFAFLRRLGSGVYSFEPVPEADKAVLARPESILLRAIALGKQGRFKIVPEFISVSATANCNLKCIMCMGHTGMSGPVLSVDETEMLFGSLVGKGVNYGRPKLLDMTSGEPTLNRDLAAIYARFKELFPGAKISIISNATLPVKGLTREAFMLADYIGLSMDGATAETYERIRKGAVYKNVVRNVRDIAEMKKPGVNCDSLRLLFVAMDQNIHELPEMVRLAHALGIPELFAQASEVREEPPFNGEGQNISLSLSKAELAPLVSEAKAEAERLGVSLSLTSTLQKALEPGQSVHPEPAAGKNAQPPDSLEVAMKTCYVPWMHAPRISQNKDGIHPTTVCCHMPHPLRRGNLTERKEFGGKSISDIFNSEFYWDIRSGLLDGALAKDACEGCQYHQMYQWTGPQLRELESAVEAAERVFDERERPPREKQDERT